MDDKVIGLNKTICKFCSADKCIIPIFIEAGFVDITKPGMLATAGRFMTMPKGAMLKRLGIETVKRIFINHGYLIKEEST